MIERTEAKASEGRKSKSKGSETSGEKKRHRQWAKDAFKMRQIKTRKVRSTEITYKKNKKRRKRTCQ